MEVSILIKRTLSALVLIALIVLAVIVKWFFNIIVMCFIICGLYEFFTMLEKKGITPYKYFGTVMGIIIPLSIMLRFELSRKWELLCIILSLVFLIIMQFKRRKNSGVIVDISTTIFGVIYVSWFFSFLIKIRYMDAGCGLLAAVLLMTKLGDIGAYLVGVRFGTHALVPRISPNKSVEGAIGGLVFSVLGAIAAQPFLQISYFHAVVLGACLGILGQLGDLSESLIKRDCQVKDAGNIIPGMGGVLDTMDSLLFTAPVFYFYLNIIS